MQTKALSSAICGIGVLNGITLIISDCYHAKSTLFSNSNEKTDK